jgi:hypothetical protein
MSDKRATERVHWLVANEKCWRGYRLSKNVVHALFGMMQVAGLYSHSTGWYDCGIPRLVKRAKEALKIREHYRSLK